jgi:hypothetical protein
MPAVYLAPAFFVDIEQNMGNAESGKFFALTPYSRQKRPMTIIQLCYFVMNDVNWLPDQAR